MLISYGAEKKWGFGGIFVAKQNKNHDKTGRNRKFNFKKRKSINLS